MKKLKRQIAPLLSGIAALLLAACALEPFTAAPAAAGRKTGRVVISIAAPGEDAGSRTLLPEYGELTYTVTITRNGETTPVFDEPIPGTSAAVDLEAGDYTLTVTAYKTDPTVPAAEGSVPAKVDAGESVSITVPLALNQGGAGTLDYAVTLPEGMTLTKGFLTLYPLSGGTTSINVDLSGDGNPFTANGVTIPSGYYRAQLSIYGSIGGAGKFAGNTRALHIIDSLTTTAPAYTLTTDDFTNTELYTVENPTELNDALTSIRDTSGIVFTVLVSASFSFPPFSLTDSGYNGKNITLRGSGGIREISLSSQGSLFTVGSASSEPVFILRDITLKGITNNNAALLRVNKGGLIMESGATVAGNITYNSESSTSDIFYSHGGGVYVAGGSFTMRNNALVSGNTASAYVSIAMTNSYSYSYGGGIYVASGSFTMQDSASVSGNTASAFSSSVTPRSYSHGGGVYVAGGSFTMQDSASVSGNTVTASSMIRNGGYPNYVFSYSYGSGVYLANGASFIMQGNTSIGGNMTSVDFNGANNSYSTSGGGVHIANGGTLTKTGGVIYGSNETGKDSDGKDLKNTALNGAAVYYDTSPAKQRNTTVETGQNLSTGSDANWSD